jgi:hypothetical protein
MDAQEPRDFSGVRTEESPEPTDPTFIGKLKLLCPSLYFSLSAWERDHLDSVFLSDMLHSSEVGKGKDLDSVQEITDLVDDRTMPIPGTVTNQEKSPLVLPETLTVEDSNIVLGYGEPVSSDHSLDRIISALVPSFSETSSPTLIPTYLGKEVVVRTNSMDITELLRVMGLLQGRILRGRGVWGMNYPLSKLGVPVKRRGPTILLSAKQNPSNLEQGALRGMKSLARDKS